MAHAVIKYRVDLIINLINTSTGAMVSEKNVILYGDGSKLNTLIKDLGIFILCNTGRNNFKLEVEVIGYEPEVIMVDYELLDKEVPTIDIHLIPKINLNNSNNLCELKGKKEGIEKIEAISLDDNLCKISEYDERKRIITMFNPHNLYLDKIYYGILNNSTMEYQVIKIKKIISETTVKTEKILEKEYQINSNISRIIFGGIYEDSQYILRVNNGSKNAKYIVRYIVNEKEYFKLVDFNDESTCNLD